MPGCPLFVSGPSAGCRGGAARVPGRPGRLRARRSRSGQRARRHPRHAAGRPRRQLRLRRGARRRCSMRWPRAARASPSATTTTPLTLSAHTSLFTGTWPTTHGVRDNTGFYVDDAVTTLAEVLKARGYRTGGFVGAFVLDARWGIAQGFDHYFDDFDLTEDVGPGLDAIQRPGAEVVDARARLAASSPTRARSSAGCTSTIRTRPYDAPPEFAVALPGHARRRLRRRDRLHRRAGRPAARRARRPPAASTTRSSSCSADHGEQLGEHREQAHGFFVYDAVGAGSADHRRSGRATARRARPGAHRRRDADGAGSGRRRRARRRCRARRCGRRSSGQRAGRCWPSRKPGIRASTTAGAS